jgi:hypothetical protein
VTRLVIRLVAAAALITAAAAGLYSGNQPTDGRVCLDRRVDDASPVAPPATPPESRPWGCVGDETAGIPPHGPRITAC